MLSLRNLVIPCIAFMSIMLFTNQFFDSYSRLERAIWNSGHFVLFALSVWLLLTHTKLKNDGWKKLLIISLLFSFIIGMSIELIQSTIGRDMDRADLITDILGGFFGFLLAATAWREIKESKIRPYIYITMGLVFLIAFYPVTHILLDNYRMQSRFPVLADFESSAELQRWEHANVIRFETSTDHVSNGDYSLYVKFGLSQYPQISLLHFPSDWSGYDYLNLDIYNTQKIPTRIVLKVYDRLHRLRGSVLNDRYNQVFTLKPGWNKLQVSLQRIKNAPATRLMNIDDIALVSLFIIEPEKSVSIYVDNLSLSM